MMKTCNAVYWIALAIWLSALIAVGVSASFTFATLKNEPLDLRLGAYEQFDGEQHWRIAAGHVTEPIFTFVDVVQVPAAGLVVVALVLQLSVFRMKWRRPANVIRSVAIVVVAALFLIRVVWLMPTMNADLRAYRDAARVGDVATAQQHRDAFNENHHRARPMMDWSLALLLLAVAASAAAFTPGAGGEPKTNMQMPNLARKK